MDNDTLMLLARFTIQARKVAGPIDTSMLAKDAAYAANIFQKIEQHADEELIFLSLTLRKRLGLLAPNVATSSPEPEPEPEPPKDNKYKFGVRG